MKTVLSLTKLDISIYSNFFFYSNDSGSLALYISFSAMLQKDLNNFSRKYSVMYLNNYSHGKSVALCSLWFLFVWAISSEK